MNDHWNVLYQVSVFYADWNSKMTTIAGHKLTLDPMGKCSNAFFSETTNMIKAKLYMNVHWMVLYNLKFFCSDVKFKMAATAGLSFFFFFFFFFYHNIVYSKSPVYNNLNGPGVNIKGPCFT